MLLEYKSIAIGEIVLLVKNSHDAIYRCFQRNINE